MIVVVGALVLLTLIAWPWLSEKIAIDRRLDAMDAGGRWLEEDQMRSREEPAAEAESSSAAIRATRQGPEVPQRHKAGRP
jgi:hypothetical protein